jgi:alpha-tubulin suppressor-like RCC1 family protein
LAVMTTAALLSACQLDERVLFARDSGGGDGLPSAAHDAAAGAPDASAVDRDAWAEGPGEASSPDAVAPDLARADAPFDAASDLGVLDLASSDEAVEAADAPSNEAVDAADAPTSGGDRGSCSLPFSAIAAGGDGVCALRRDGRVACWGATATSQSARPVLVPGLTGVTALALGQADPVCALRSDGSVWCWGGGQGGTLGNGATASSPTPVRVSNLTGAKAIAAGTSAACAIDSDGAVWCWGDNGEGELGNGSLGAESCPGSDVCSAVPVRVSNLTNAVSVTAGEAHACAVRSDGTVWCWGRNDGELGNGTTGPVTSCRPDSGTPCSRVPVQVSGLTEVTAVAAGGDHTCALRANGEVWCWGDNTAGWLGNGTFINDFIRAPVQVSGLTDATAISASLYRSCAVRATGGVVCWGDNLDGSLGIGNSTGPLMGGSAPFSTTPLPVVQLTGATSVAVGEDHVCALRADGTVACWGANWSGQLGTGSLTGPETCSPGNPSFCSTTPVAIAPAIAAPTACGGTADAGVAGACALGETRCASGTSLETCEITCDGCTAFVASPCPVAEVCGRAAPAACVDPSWAQWPMPNDQVDVTAGAPNLQTHVNNYDGTVTDAVTGLVWQLQPQSPTFTYADATAYCATLSLDGFADWRLPSLIELVSISEYAASDPRPDPLFFGDVTTETFWSSTVVADSTYWAWVVVYREGRYTYFDSMGTQNAVRCVR